MESPFDIEPVKRKRATTTFTGLVKPKPVAVDAHGIRLAHQLGNTSVKGNAFVGARSPGTVARLKKAGLIPNEQERMRGGVQFQIGKK